MISELRESIKKFCVDRINPTVEEDDKNETFKVDIFEGLGEMGLTAMTLPEEYEGLGLKLGDSVEALEEVAKYSLSYAITISVSNMVADIILRGAKEDLKKKFLPPLAQGKMIGAFCLSESHAGSDPRSMRTSFQEENDSYVIKGHKMWITSGGISGVYVVMAKDNASGEISSFLVPADTAGVEFGKKESKMGWRVSPTREVIFNNCKIPKENLLGQKGKGLNVAFAGLDKGRITVGCLANGLSVRAIEEATKYALDRDQFGQKIFDFQGLQFMLADMMTEMAASRLLVKDAAEKFDQGKSEPILASMAKLKSTDSAMKITTDAVQILGGVGYTTEYPVERLMRDAKVLQIVEGTNQIQKMVIGRELKKRFSS